jgi:heme/copper-type cytochrome/quinol oxidase subunit 3
MVWLIATEAVLFSMLLMSYWFLRFQSTPVWPPDGIDKPKLTLVLIMTAILWSSSLPVHLAHRAVRLGHQVAAQFWMLIGWFPGLLFVALELGVEWPHTLKEFNPQTNAYGSLYFTITGFHALHVIIGLMVSAWVQVRLWRGAYDMHRHVSVQNFSMYWQFVDLVWVFVLLTVYLSPYL